LKASLLGLEKLEYHERNVEYGEIDADYSYDKSVEMVREVLSGLDDELVSIFNQFVSGGNIDPFPSQGKRPGAFAMAVLPSQPSYILLNHTNRLNDVLTLAHEVGHGINNELVRGKQNSLYFDTPLSTAEVASTFMEDFVLDEILKEADDELRLAIMMMKLNSDISTIIRQVAAYRFEQELHVEYRKRGYLAQDEIGELFSGHMQSYMGDSVEQSEGSENWWVYWSHLRAFFYNYSYASGLLISKSLQAKTKADPKFIHEVKGFLSAGTSDSPQNIFAKLGIDITQASFWQQGIDEVRTLLDQTRELATKLGKI
jgi:oligoendopeptidase F